MTAEPTPTAPVTAEGPRVVTMTVRDILALLAVVLGLAAGCTAAFLSGLVIGLACLAGCLLILGVLLGIGT